MAKNVQVIPAQMELRQKVVNFKTGVDIAMTPAQLDELEEVIQESKDEFVVEAASILKKLRMDVARARANKDDAETFVEIAQDAAYDIKALGGTFNYPLMTAIAKSLHNFLYERTTLEGKQYDLVSLHIDMLYLVLSRQMDGPGGVTEQQIVLALQEGARRFG
jgi:hypothetical protein